MPIHFLFTFYKKYATIKQALKGESSMYQFCKENREVQKKFNLEELIRIHTFENYYQDFINDLACISSGVYDENKVTEIYFNYDSCKNDILKLIENGTLEKLDVGSYLLKSNNNYEILKNFMTSYEFSMIKYHIVEFCNLDTYFDKNINFKILEDRINNDFYKCNVDNIALNYYQELKQENPGLAEEYLFTLMKKTIPLIRENIERKTVEYSYFPTLEENVLSVNHQQKMQNYIDNHESVIGILEKRRK